MKDNYEYFYSLDFFKLTDYKEIHPIIQKSLDFPDYYGKNWSAFWECLTEMVDEDEVLYIELIGLEVLQQKFPHASDKMLEILKRLKHYDNETYYDMIKIEIVVGEIRYEIY